MGGAHWLTSIIFCKTRKVLFYDIIQCNGLWHLFIHSCTTYGVISSQSCKTENINSHLSVKCHFPLLHSLTSTFGVVSYLDFILCWSKLYDSDLTSIIWCFITLYIYDWHRHQLRLGTQSQTWVKFGIISGLVLSI